MAQENVFGIEPYAFEPEYKEDELENLATGNNPSSPIIPTLDEWCSCGHCEVMPTVEECVCCKQCDYTVGNMGDLGCIPVRSANSKSRCSVHCFYSIHGVEKTTRSCTRTLIQQVRLIDLSIIINNLQNSLSNI